MFPCWLIVSNVSGATTSLRDSITSSGYRRLLSDASSGILSVSQRETTVILPKTVVGRYVRIQRQDPLYLSIAEVEVYSDRTRVCYCYCTSLTGIAGYLSFHHNIIMAQCVAHALKGLVYRTPVFLAHADVTKT
jgi:hypothetical protein